jgi:hypothetical protein
MATDAELLAALAANALRAPLVAVGTVVAVGPGPGMWSGRFPAYQEVTYRVQRWIRLRPPLWPPDDVLVVRHLVVFKSRTAHPTEARLNEEMFRPGAVMVLFIDLVDNAWTCIDENYGAVPVGPGVEELVSQAVAQARGKGPSP